MNITKNQIRVDLITLYLHTIVGRTVESITAEDIDSTCLAHATHELYNKHRVFHTDKIGYAFLQKELDSELLEIGMFAFPKRFRDDIESIYSEAMDTVDFEEYDEFPDSDIQDIAYLIEEHHLPVYVLTATVDKENACYDDDVSLTKCSIGTKIKFDYFNEDEED